MRARVGTGFDVHPFTDEPERLLVLGGVQLPGERGLSGHSDADVVTHAVADAILGAAGLDDLGERFPASDQRWRGADSISLLVEVTSAVRAAGFSVVNVDCSVVAEAPRLAPYRRAMEQRLSEAVDAPVSVKPKHAEGLGTLGRQEGIACWAVALLEGWGSE